MKQDTKSLLDRIKRAETKDEIEALLDEGETLKWADPATRRKWSRSAKKRKGELK